MDPDNVDALCDRAELYVSQQMYEEAIKDYQKAKDVENHPPKVHCMLTVRRARNFHGSDLLQISRK